MGDEYILTHAKFFLPGWRVLPAPPWPRWQGTTNHGRCLRRSPADVEKNGRKRAGFDYPDGERMKWFFTQCTHAGPKKLRPASFNKATDQVAFKAGI